MHFGGIHFFGGLFYLILSCLVVAIWLAVLWLAVICLWRLFQKLRRHKATIFSRSRMRKMVLFALSFSLILHLFVYVDGRRVWCGSDNANFAAKEYFVAGRPLAGMRLILCRFLNPDNPLLLPLNATQWLIYKQGIKQLPENDGEIGVWADLWFNYPYILRMHEPYGTNKTKPSLKMRKLLDRIWFSMEAMSTKSFADKQMEQQNYFRNFPRSAFYYVLKDGYYHDRKIGSSFHLLKEASFVERERLLYDWVVLLRQRWIEQGLYEQIKERYPKIEAERQVVAINTLEMIVGASIYSETFNCDSPYITQYVAARHEFVAEDHPNHVLKRLKYRQRRQAEDLYVIGVGSVESAFQKYILKKYCGMDVLGSRQPLGLTHPEAIKRRIEDEVIHLFKNELKLIEEGQHE